MKNATCTQKNVCEIYPITPSTLQNKIQEKYIILLSYNLWLSGSPFIQYYMDMKIENPFRRRKEVWNGERNYGDNPGSMLAFDPLDVWYLCINS